MATEKMRKITRDRAMVEVKFDDQKILLENVFIGGRLDSEKTSVGFYSGSLDIGEMGVSLMHMLRGVLKATYEEVGLSRNKSIEFIQHCLVEAIGREIAEEAENETERTKEELRNVVKRFMESQN
jgi:hypothetical protein